MFKLVHVNELYLTEYRLKNSCFSGNVWSALNACHPMLTDCKDELKYLYSDIWTSVLFVEKSVILYMWRTFREIDVCQRHPCQITFKNWISTFFLTTKLNTVDDIWRFRLYLCLTQKFNFTWIYCTSKSPHSHSNLLLYDTFIPSSKWRIFPRKGLYTKHPRKRLARNNRWFPTTLKTFAEKCIMVTINMNWRLTKIDFDLMLNIQDTP